MTRWPQQQTVELRLKLSHAKAEYSMRVYLCLHVSWIAPLTPIKHCGKANANSCKCSTECTKEFSFAGVTAAALHVGNGTLTPATTNMEKRQKRLSIMHHFGGANHLMWLNILLLPTSSFEKSSCGATTGTISCFNIDKQMVNFSQDVVLNQVNMCVQYYLN